MSRDFERAGADQYISSTTIPYTGYPYTMACWYKMESTHTDEYMLMGVSDASATFDDFIALRLDDTNGSSTVQHNVARQTVRSASTSTTWTVGVWEHACAVGTSATDRAVYLNGTNEGTNTTSAIPNAGVMDQFSIGAFFSTGAVIDHHDGLIAHATYWAAALDIAEVKALAAGAHPLSIRPASIIHYYPLDGNTDPEPDLVGSIGLTVTNATKGVETYPITRGAQIIQFPPPADVLQAQIQM